MASLVDTEAAKYPSRESTSSKPAAATTLRLEGPYFTLATPDAYENVLCLVAGTGLSGALAIAAAFRAQAGLAPSCFLSSDTSANKEAPGAQTCTVSQGNGGKRRWKTCTIVWTVRETDYVDMPFFQGK